MIKVQDAVASVIRALQRNDIPLDKVILHKFIYFLGARGIRTGFRFEPWTYGPFSFDLADTLNDMVFWDKIKVSGQNKNRFEVVDLDSFCQLDSQIEKKIDDYLKDFKKLVGSFSFDNIECIGTALYCAESIAFQGEEVTESRVVKEFQEWKGKKYSQEKIQNAYRRLKPYLSYS